MKTSDAIILNSFLFHNVTSASTILSSLKLSPPKFYKKNDVVYYETCFERSLGIILSGKVVAVSNSAKQLPLSTFSEGDIFGAAALFGAVNTYVSRIIASTDCAIQFISEQELINLFQIDSQISVNYIMFLSAKIRFLNSKLALFNEDNVESRLYKWLQSNIDKQGTLPKGYSMTKIAETLGIGRTSLYRAFESLDSKGLILRTDKKIEVIEK